jgi:hypothetical protein
MGAWTGPFREYLAMVIMPRDISLLTTSTCCEELS